MEGVSVVGGAVEGVPVVGGAVEGVSLDVASNR